MVMDAILTSLARESVPDAVVSVRSLDGRREIHLTVGDYRAARRVVKASPSFPDPLRECLRAMVRTYERRNAA
jgi:hypothetical protein